MKRLRDKTRMIYPIVKLGEPVLEKPADPVTEFDEGLKKLVEDMFESMYEAHGVGLAAPQIGIGKRIAVDRCDFQGRSQSQARTRESARSFTPKGGILRRKAA